MPELTAINIVWLTAMLILGILGGWKFRGGRARQEKAAINSGWQGQIEAQRTEHDRLTEQSKGIMEQIGQYQASNRDAKNRARELSDSVRDALERRDELQREIKEIRAKLDVVIKERDQLQKDMRTYKDDNKDAKIVKLRKEVANWQNRVPPLIENFRERNSEALKFEEDLHDAKKRVVELEAELENQRISNETRIEQVHNPDALTDGRDASNDLLDDDDVDIQIDFASIAEAAGLTDKESNEPAYGQRDKLQQIKGIGPAIEKTLNEMGIFQFQQIAEMSEYDIDRVAKRLKGFHSRIYREDWIGQAREFRDQSANG